MLIVGNPPQNTLQELDMISISIDSSCDSFLKRMANTLFTKEQLTLCWYPESKIIGDVHSLFNDAYSSVQNEIDIGNTSIGKLLLKLTLISHEIVLWYGSDLYNLSRTEDARIFMNTISSNLQEGAGELYLRFEPEVLKDKKNR
jgi:hypothetical protein